MEKEEEVDQKLEYVEAGELRPSSSFELKSTSRGVTVRVKIYSCDTISDIEKAQKEAEKRFKELCEKYGCGIDE